jgi:hypothetical protein
VPGPPPEAIPGQRTAAVCLAAAGIAALATGMLFGTGTVIGASAAFRLIRQPDPVSGHPDRAAG